MNIVADGAEFEVNTVADGQQWRPAITALYDPTSGDYAGYVVVWMSQAGDSWWNVKMQRFDAAGAPVGSEVFVNTTQAGYQGEPHITTLDNGCYVVSWNGDTTASIQNPYGIFAQVYAPDGTAIGANILVTGATYPHEYDSQVVAVDGGFIVTYTQDTTDGSNSGIFAQRFDVDGTGTTAADFAVAMTDAAGDTASPASFRINATTAGTQTLATSVALADGGALVFYSSPDASSYGVLARRIAADGTLGAEIDLSSELGGFQGRVSAVQLLNGNIFAAWTSDGQDASHYGVYGRILDSSGNPISEEFRLNQNTYSYQSYDSPGEGPRLVLLADGSVVASWGSYNGSDEDVVARRFDQNGNPDGNEVTLNAPGGGYQYHIDMVSTDGDQIVAVWQTQAGDINGWYEINGRSFTIASTPIQEYDQISHVGGQDLVNTNTFYDQRSPQVVALADGGYLIMWRSQTTLATGDGSDWGLFAQRYDALGNQIGGEFQLNENPLGEQYYGHIAAKADGGFIVTWHNTGTSGDNGSDVWARIFDSNHVGGTAFRVNTTLPGEQAFPDVAVLDDPSGDFLVTYRTHSEGGNSYDVWVQRFNSDGTVDGARVKASEPGNGANTTDGGEHQARVEALDDGRYVVVFEDNWGNPHADPLVTTDDVSGNGLYGRVYEADGSPAGDIFQINQFTPGDQGGMQLAKLADGGFVVSWTDNSADGWSEGIYARIYDAAGVPAGDAFRVTGNWVNGQFHSGVTVLADGSIMFTWATDHPDAYGSTDIYGARYTADGQLIGNEFLINTSVNVGNDREPSIAATADGFVVTWHEENGGSGSYDGSHRSVWKQQFTIDGLNYVSGAELTPATVTVAPIVGPEDSAIPIDIEIEWGVVPDQVYGEISNIPVGATISDGVHSFTATAADHTVYIDETWDRDSLTITPPANRESDFTLEIRIRGITDNGAGGESTVTTVKTITVDVIPQLEQVLIDAPETRVNTYTPSTQDDVHVAVGPDGSRVVTWTSHGGDLGTYGVMMQRYAADGTPQGSAQVLQTNPAGDQYSTDIAFLPDGNFVAVWRDDSQGRYQVRQQLFAPDGTRIGAEVQVHTPNNFYGGLDPSVIALEDGDYLIAWYSDGAGQGDASSGGTFAQRFDADGTMVSRDGATPGADNFMLNTTTSGNQYTPMLSALQGGGWMAVWIADGQAGDVSQGLFGQAFDADGNKVGAEFHVNQRTDNTQYEPHMVTLANGNVVVTWASNSAADADWSDYGAIARIFAPDGTAVSDEIQMNAFLTSGQGWAPVIALPDGGFFAAWQTNGQDGDSWGIVGQRFAADGDKVGPEVYINAVRGDQQRNPDIAYDATNDTIVAVWQSNTQGDGNGWGVVTREFSLPETNATAVGGLVVVPTAIAHEQAAPAIATLADQSYVVVWQTQPNAGQGDASSWSVRAQRFDADGNRLGGEITVNTNILGDQSQPEVIALDGGGYVIVWHSATGDGNGYGLFGQKFDDSGTKVGEEFQINAGAPGDQTWPDITALHGVHAGGFVVAWETSDNVYARAFGADGNAIGTGDLAVSQFIERVNNGDSTEDRVRVAADADGGFILVWQDGDGDKAGWATIGQRYVFDAGTSTYVTAPSENSDGTISATNFRINTAFYNTQYHPAIETLADGRYVVVWFSAAPDQYGLHGQFYNADGTRDGDEFLVDGNHAGYADTPDISALADGGFVVAFHADWSDSNGENVGVLRLDSTGKLLEVHMVSTSNRQLEPQVVAQGDGFTLVFVSDDARDGWGNGFQDHGNEARGIFLQHYALDGGPTGGVTAHRPTLTVSGTVSGNEDTSIAIPVSAAIANSDSAFEELRVTIENIPVGATLSDGTNSFTATVQRPTADVSGWNLAALTIAPATDYNGTFSLVVRATEHDQGDFASNTAIVAVTVNPVDEVLPDYGAERRDNDTINSWQYDPGVASQADGSYLVVWRSDGQPSGANPQIVGQLHAADGEKIGGEFPISNPIGNYGWDPEVRALLSGDYVVVYSAYDVNGEAVYAQRVAADGTLLNIAGGTESPNRVQVNTFTTSTQNDPEVTVLEDGGWVVVWQSWSQDGGTDINGNPQNTYGIYAQRFAADGTKVGAEYFVSHDDPQVGDPGDGGLAERNNTRGDQLHPAVAQLASGDLLYTWHTPDNAGNGIVGRIVTLDGDEGRVFPVSGTQTFTQEGTQIIALANGRAVIVWHSNGEDGSGWGVYGQIVNADGSLQGTQFRVSSYGYDAQHDPVLTALPDGGFMVVWMSVHQDGSDWGVYGQRYDAAGIEVGTEFRVNTTVPGSQHYPAITVQGDGSGIIVAFRGPDGSGDGIYDIRLPLPDATEPQDISRLGQETRVNPTESAGLHWNQEGAAVTKLHDGSYVVTYHSNGQDGSGWGVYARHYTAGGDPIPWDGVTDSPLEMRINVSTNNSQHTPSIVALPEEIGGFVIAWYDDSGAGGTGTDVYARRFNNDGSDNQLLDSAGTPVTALKVSGNASSANDFSPKLAVGNDGQVLVTWHSDRIGQSYDVYSHLIDENGQLATGGDNRLNVITGDQQAEARAFALNDGNFIAVWHSYNQDGSSVGIYGRLLGPDGVPLAGQSDFLINSNTDSEQSWPTVAALTGGGFVVTWLTHTSFDSDTSGYGIAAQRFDNDGNTIGSEFRINGIARDNQLYPEVIATQDGGFVIGWQSDNADGSGTAVEVRRFDADGNPLDPYGNDVQVNTVSTANNQGDIALALLDRGFVAVWTSYENDFGSSFSNNIKMQRFAGAGLEPPPYIVDAATGDDDPNDLIFSTIQEAIDEAPIGRTIQIKGGIYNEALTVSTDDLKITNAPGEIVTIISPNGDSPTLTVVEDVSITIQGESAANLTFQSAADNTGDAGGMAIDFLGNNDQSVIDKITVTGTEGGIHFGPGQTGLLIQNSTFNGPSNLVIEGADGGDPSVDAQILRNTFNTTDGTALDSAGNNGKISLNVFDGTASGAAGEASLILRGTGVDVSTNNFEADDGVHFRPIGSTYPLGTLISQNSFPEGYVTVSSTTSIYASIQQAVNEANAGDTISISGGTWSGEGVVEVPVNNLTVTGPGGVQPALGVELLLGDGVTTLTLAGGAPINVTGNGLDNVITGNSADNEIDGGDGNDTLVGGLGDDTINGGAGTDGITVTLSGSGFDDVAGGGQDNDTVTLLGTELGGATTTLFQNGGQVFAHIGAWGAAHAIGVENVVFRTSHDGDVQLNGFVLSADITNSLKAIIYGGDGANTIDATGSIGLILANSSIGNDHFAGNGGTVFSLLFNGANGNVRMNLGTTDRTHGAVTVLAGTGTDEFGYTDTFALPGFASIATGNGNDILFGNNANNTFSTANGDDAAYGAGGNDTFNGDEGTGTKNWYGELGNDTYNVTTATQIVQEAAGEGNDTVNSRVASYSLTANVENLVGQLTTGQTLNGNSGANVITTEAGAGVDTVDAGAGNDTISAGASGDSLNGGADIDTVSYSRIATSVAVDLFADTGVKSTGTDTLTLIENATGSAQSDDLRGDGGVNVLIGGAGNDFLVGRGGNDTITGGTDSDTAGYLTTAADGLLARSGGGHTFNGISGSEGTDTLDGIEAIRLAGGDGAFNTGDDRLFNIAGGNVAIQVAADTGNATEPGGLANATAGVNATGNVLSNDINLDQDAGASDVEAVTTIVWTSATGPGSASGTTTATAVTAGGVTIQGRYGSLTINAAGAYTYTPDAAKSDLIPQGTNGVETFTYQATDGIGAAATTTLTITLAGRNDTPVASDVSASGGENDGSIGGTLAASDVDQGNTMSYALVAGSVKVNGATVADSTVTVNANGSYSYTPVAADNALNLNETRVITFDFTATDGTATSPAETATITVNGANDAPSAVADTGSTGENTTADFNVLVNDTDADTTHVFTLVSTSAPSGKGTVSVVSNQVRFNPGTVFDHLAQDASENVVVSYTMQDEHGIQSSSSLTVTVNGANDAPVANDDIASGGENATVDINVLANDTDVDDGAILNIDAASVPAGQGSVSIVGNQIRFNPGTDFNDLAAGATEQMTISYTVEDQHGAQDNGSVTYTVNGVNDAPAGTSATKTVNEDTFYTLAAGDFGFSDVDGGTFAGVEIATLPTDGRLFLDNVEMTVANTFVSAADIAAGKLRFRGDSNENGTGYASFTFAVRDNGPTGSGNLNQDQSANTLTFNVTAVNDAPTVAIAALGTATEQTPLNLKGKFTIADVDSPAGSMTATLSVTSGVLDVTAGNSGVTGITGSGTGTVTITGSRVQIQALLNSGTSTVTYTADSDAPPSSTTLTLTLDDNGANGTGGAKSGTDSETIAITAVNDEPEGADNTGNVSESGEYVFGAADFEFSDVDGNAFAGVEIVTLPGAGELRLDGVEITTLPTFVTAAQLAAGDLTFAPDPGASGNDYANFTFAVRDDGATGGANVNQDASPNTFTFNISEINSAPMVDVVAPLVATEQTVLSLKGKLNVSDGDAGTGSLTATLSVDAGVLTVTAGDSGVTGITGSGTQTVTITGTVAQITALFSAGSTSVVSFTPAGGDTPAASANLTLDVNDNGNTGLGGAQSGADSETITITAVNDAPAGANGSTTIAEDGDYTFVAADFGFSDVDGNVFLGIEVSSLPTNGKLFLLATEITTAPTWVSAAQIGAGDLRFVPDANENGTGYGSFTFAVRDDGTSGGLDTNQDQSPNTFTVNVTAVNDAPVNSLGGSIGTGEDAVDAWMSGMSISDVDANPATDEITVTFDVDHGTLDIDTNVMGGIEAGDVTGDESGSITVTATLNQINATLAATNGLTYSPDANFNGDDTLTVTSNDQGHDGLDPGATGTGTSEQDSDTRTISVSSINDAPSGADNTKAMAKDATYTFAAADFGFSDVDGDDIAGVEIASLPTDGNLFLDGIEITGVPAFVTAAQLTAGDLTFIPDAGESGIPYANFTFAVRDDGGTANGGVDQDQTANTFTFNISSINSAPVVDVVGPLNASEQVPLSLKGKLIVSDTDAGSGVLTATLSVGFGAQLNVTAGTSGANVSGSGTQTVTITGTLAQINALLSTDANSIVRFIALNNNPVSSATLTLSVNDNGNTGTGGALVASDSETVTVTALNDAPSGTNNTKLILEDGDYTFAAADFGFGDVDGGSFAGIEIASLPTDGKLFLDGIEIAGTPTFVTAAQIAAGELQFVPDADETGAPYGSFTFAVRDDGATGGGDVNQDQAPNTFTFDVSALNDAPVASIAGPLTATEQVFASLKGKLSVSDVDAGSSVITATLTVDAGRLNVTSGTSGASVTVVDPMTVTLTGTVAQINALLATDAMSTVRFLASGDNPPNSATLTLAVNDGGSSGTGGALSGSDSETIAITVVDDPAVAKDDAFTTAENAATSGSAFGNNGSGIDRDIDGPPLQVSAVNGNPGNVGTQFALASGALLTLNADGTFDYDPNGAFDDLTVIDGADNDSGTDTFTYTLAGGGTATVTITITAVDNPGDIAEGSAGDDEIGGTPDNDFYLVDQGGDDDIDAGDGDDAFYFGDEFGDGDTVDGGAGSDQLGLHGEYNLDFTTLDPNILNDVESIKLFSGSDTMGGHHPGGESYDYSLVMSDANVDAGEYLFIKAQQLTAGETLYFDGSNETDGVFGVRGGAGDDTIIGGGGNDIIVGKGGADLLTGGAGNDLFGYTGADESTPGARDRITDFAAGDVIHLQAVDAIEGSAADDAFTLIGDAAFGNIAGQLRVFESDPATSTWLVEGDLDGDGAADFAIEVFTNGQPLIGADFVL